MELDYYDQYESTWNYLRNFKTKCEKSLEMYANSKDERYVEMGEYDLKIEDVLQCFKYEKTKFQVSFIGKSYKEKSGRQVQRAYLKKI